MIVRKLQTTSAKRKEWVDRRAECANLDVQIALTAEQKWIRSENNDKN